MRAATLNLTWEPLFETMFADVPAILKEVTPRRFAPSINISPPIATCRGVALLTVGEAVITSSNPLLLTPSELTVTKLMPGARFGTTALIWVAELIVKLVAGVAPKSTLSTVDRFIPDIVTVAPLKASVGESAFKAGAGTIVKDPRLVASNPELKTLTVEVVTPEVGSVART